MSFGIDPGELTIAQRNALLRQGEAILKQNPRDKNVLAQLGTLYLANGDIKTAIDRLQAAYRLDKRNIEVIGQLVNANNDAKQYNTGRKYARKLVEIAPREPVFVKAYAETLEFCGQYDKALEVWQRMIQLNPGSAAPLGMMAACLRTMGKMEEALEWFGKVLEIDPIDAEALYMVAQSRRFTAEEAPEFVDRIEKAAAKVGDDGDLEAESEGNIRKGNLYFAAGKVLADVGRNDDAFAYYKKANDIKLRKDPADREAAYRSSLKKMRNGIEAYDKKLFLEKSGMGDPWDAPIFILGMPRSGTTLTESLVGGHSLVIAGDELSHMGRITKGIGQDESEAEAVSRVLHSMTKADMDQIGGLYRESTAALAKKNRHFTDKMPHNFMSIGMIRLLFPNAKIIHCRRHPIDNCLSIYTNSMNDSHNRYKSDLRTLGLYYRQYLRLMQHWREVLPGGFHEVCYEDMVANTELNARAIMEYLGLEWEDTIMDRNKSQKGVRTLSAWQVRQPVYTTSAGRWRKFEKHLGSLIETLGSAVGDYEAELAELGKVTDK